MNDKFSNKDKESKTVTTVRLKSKLYDMLKERNMNLSAFVEHNLEAHFAGKTLDEVKEERKVEEQHEKNSKDRAKEQYEKECAYWHKQYSNSHNSYAAEQTLKKGAQALSQIFNIPFPEAKTEIKRVRE